ncbi:MAG: YbaB/EbfC family nucleoid-associated protein [Desulfobulbus sp.]|jgi:DNA-binding YbaB/EbfC family protein|nr:MAG: YbaB/EbfC family nucleoid-associated protein [Desulfobulbus sp.]
MDMNMLMKQAQQFQERLSKMQEELGSKTVSGSAGGGMVTATANGRGELLSLTLERGVVNPDDIQLLQDLVLSAVNEALRKAKQLGQGEMGKLTGGMHIPGLF